MPKLLKIITHPNKILRQKSKEVKMAEIRDPKFQKLIADMYFTMLSKDGAGLAAPQIAKNIRLIVIRFEDHDLILINPQITKKSWAKEIGEEGCLSVLNDQGQIIFGNVLRHKKINCIYVDHLGQKQKLIAENMLARVIQHEIDHLDGILFIDKLV
jgi:peptide deformylase